MKRGHGLLRGAFKFRSLSATISPMTSTPFAARTVLLNARLLPVIAMLIDSVGAVTDELGMKADIRLVTTEGSLMNPSRRRTVA